MICICSIWSIKLLWQIMVETCELYTHRDKKRAAVSKKLPNSIAGEPLGGRLQIVVLCGVALVI